MEAAGAQRPPFSLPGPPASVRDRLHPTGRPSEGRAASLCLPGEARAVWGGGNAPAFMPTGRGWTRWVLSSCPQGAQASEGDRWGQRALARCDKCTHAAWVMRRGESAPQKTPAPTALTLTPGRASPPGPVPGELCTDLGHRGSW